MTPALIFWSCWAIISLITAGLIFSRFEDAKDDVFWAIVLSVFFPFFYITFAIDARQNPAVWTCLFFGHEVEIESDEGAPYVHRCVRCGWRHDLDGK